MATKIIDKDNGYKKVMKLLTKGKHLILAVGVFGDKASETHEGSELTVGEIGAFHEFGLGNNPERSFIRGWVDENEENVAAFLKEKTEQAVANQEANLDNVLELLGLYCQSGIQRRMSGGIPPSLKEATIRRKGSSTPLIDTGQLRSSITYRVDKSK